MERHPIILETLVSDLFHKEKFPLSRDLGSRQLLYKHQTPLFSSMEKLSNSLTIEFIETSCSLTCHSEDFWLVPHQCLLFGPFVLIHRYPLGQLGVYNSLTILAHHQTKYEEEGDGSYKRGKRRKREGQQKKHTKEKEKRSL